MGPTITKASQGRFPNFLVIGAMKAGTTSLYHYLKAHPQVYMSAIKEPDFFVEEANWRRGLDWYSKQFQLAGTDAIALGEASTLYTKYPRYLGVPQRIAEHIPNARLIYLIRDPIDRIRSHYQHRVAEGSEKLPFDVAVFENPIYIDYSRYALQIDQYLKHFPKEQLLVITLESVRDAKQITMRKVYEFIGVDPDSVSLELNKEFYKTNERATRSSVPLWLRKALKKYFPASKQAVELESNIIQFFNRFGRRNENSKNRAKSFTIDASVREKLASLLMEDVKRLRDHMGPDFDGWGIG